MRAEVTHGKGRHSYKCNCVCKHFDSISPQPSSKNRIKFGMIIAPDCGSLRPSLNVDGVYSFFWFGVISIFAWPIENVHVW